MLGVLAAALVGSGAGWLCRYAPVPPIVQDLVATVVGCILGAVSMVAAVFVVWEQRSEAGGLGALSFGLSETVLLGVPLAIAGALLGRLALQKLADVGPVVLASHTSIFLGAAAALTSALWVSRGVVIS